MGLRVKLDIDTFEGPAQSIYCRIDQMVIQRSANRIIVSLAYFLDKDKTLPDDQLPYTILHYNDTQDNPEEVRLPNNIKIDLSQSTIMKEPIYKKQKVKEKVPYVSFDENGDELTKYREVEVEKNVKVGEEENEVSIPVYDAIQKDIFGYCYRKIEEHLNDTFKEHIKIEQE